jgi:Tol biopolymer transport system component
VLEDGSTLIAFGGGREIRTISPDGGPATTIVALRKNSSVMGGFYWSPMGTHLVYTRYQSTGNVHNDSWDVYRVGADGSNSTNLTNGLEGDSSAAGWRD